MVRIKKGVTVKESAVKKTSKTELSDSEIDDIYDTIGKIFGEDTQEKISLDIALLKTEIQEIVNKIEFSKKNKGNVLRVKQGDRKKLIAEGYLLIFKVREYLLEESIDYRYYYSDDKNGIAHVTSFTEKEILKFMRFNKKAITLIENTLKERDADNEYDALLDLHYKNLMNCMQKSNRNQSFYIVRRDIMDKYGQINPGLILKDFQNQEFSKIVSNLSSYQQFNRGHIFEAMDNAFSEAIRFNRIQNYGLIEKRVFGKFLSYDGIEGLRGGDNEMTMTQIKANAARFLKHTTIINDLKSIASLLELKQPDEIKKRIKELFLTADRGRTKKNLEKSVEDATSKVLELVSKT